MSSPTSYKKKGTIKQILKDHFKGFWELHAEAFPVGVRESVEENVKKAMKCGSRDLGYALYECKGCTEGEPEAVFVCFTCKSRFCHGCGKKYTDDWTDKQVERILDVPHRHTVFTVPKELREVFAQDRSRLTELSQEVAKVFQFYYRRMNKSKKYEVGVITVIHTFGRDLKFNPHIHALVTEGALSQEKEWKSVEFISYEYLRKAWQKLLLDLLQKWFPENPNVKQLVNELYQRYRHGFYVHAEQKMKDAKGAAKYIGRYLARPAIAEYRILSYDGEIVRFWYEDHQSGKRVEANMPVYRFLRELLQHIPPKHFRMVGRFGLYSRSKKKEAQKVVEVWNFYTKKQGVQQMAFEFNMTKAAKRKKTYRQRMLEAFDRDPLKCPCCKHTMLLVVIWHADYGRIYYYDEERERKEEKRWGKARYERREKEERTAG